MEYLHGRNNFSAEKMMICIRDVPTRELVTRMVPKGAGVAAFSPGTLAT
jgi:hypothetical protein